jgi:hypothetical protein
MGQAALFFAAEDQSRPESLSWGIDNGKAGARGFA